MTKTLTPQARWNARNQKTVKAAMRRLEARNLEIVEAELGRRGGQCVFEGCTKTKIEWHHRDPETKNFSIGSSVRQHSASRLIAELALCDPLCREHHMVVDGRLEAARNFLRTHERVQTKRKADSKLTEDQVREIRSRAKSGERAFLIRRDYPTSQSNISMIINRKKWAWLPD